MTTAEAICLEKFKAKAVPCLDCRDLFIPAPGHGNICWRCLDDTRHPADTTAYKFTGINADGEACYDER